MAETQITDTDSLRREVMELRRQIDAMRHIAVALSTATKADEIIRQALDISLKLAESEAGTIFVYHPDKDRLVFEHVVGEKSAELMGVELAPDEGLAGMVFQTGETCVSEDVHKEGAYFREIEEYIGYKTRNMVTAPLKSPGSRPLGVMQVLNKKGAPYDSYDVALIETMAAQIAVAIESARLHEEARLAAVVRLIGDISHDVKNMVTAPVTGAQTLKVIADECFGKFDQCSGATNELVHALVDLREVYPEMVEMILEGCEAVQQRMAEIAAAVKGIVSKPHFEQADVTDIVRLVETMLRAQAQKKGVALSIEPAPNVPPAIVDRKQISNAVYNLIFNAIDACDSGASVVFRIIADGDFIVLECADTGPGIPEHVKAKLFTDDAVSTKPMGTGLGTRIVKNVIDAHGGTIEVDSQVGSGTSIRCRIPITREL